MHLECLEVESSRDRAIWMMNKSKVGVINITEGKEM
jgi:hypothetical protein